MLRLVFLIAAICFAAIASAQPADTTDRSWEFQYPRQIVNLIYGRFAWRTGPVLIFPARSEDDAARGNGIKEPTAVHYGGKWHLFATIRNERPTHQIVYLSFADWGEANKGPREILKLDENYAAAPQVFYFEPQRKWYLIYQVADPKKKPEIQPVFSVCDEVANPAGWSRPQPLFETQPDNVRLWSDFWVVCDDQRAYLFFSSRDGNLWRSQTKLEQFPKGWSRPQSCLEADVLGGARVYRLKGYRKFLTIMEAQEVGRRYCKAFWADFVNGRWDELAGTEKKSFASKLNIKQDPAWIDQVSRGEILRSSYDQRMEVDPMHFQFLFAGIDEYDKVDRGYGKIPWRIGLLEGQ